MTRLVLPSLLLLTSVAIGRDYAVPSPYEGNYDSGYQAGYDFGYATGFTLGADRGVAEGTELGSEEGYSAGYEQTYQPSYDQAYEQHYQPAYDQAYQSAYDLAQPEGYDDGVAYVRELVATNDLLVVLPDGTILRSIDPWSPSGSVTLASGYTVFRDIPITPHAPSPTDGDDPSQHYYDFGFSVGSPIGEADGDTAGFESTFDTAYEAAYAPALVIGEEEGILEGLFNGAADGESYGTTDGTYFGDLAGYDAGLDEGLGWAWDQLGWAVDGSVDLQDVQLAAPAYFFQNRGEPVPEPASVLLIAAAMGVWSTCRCRTS